MTVAAALLAVLVASTSGASPGKRSKAPAPTPAAKVPASAKGSGSAVGSKRAQDQIELAQSLLEDLDYERALERLAAARLEKPSPEQELLIALLEGTLQVELGRTELGKLSFRRALLADAEARLPLDVSPKVKAAFESVKEALRAEVQETPLPAKDDPPRFIEVPPAVTVATPAPSEPPTVVETGGGAPVATIVGVTGGALLLGGGVFYFLAKSSEGQLRDGDPSVATAEQAMAVRQTGETRQTVAFALGSAGLVAVGVAAGMVFFGEKDAQVAFAPLNGGALVGFGGAY